MLITVIIFIYLFIIRFYNIDVFVNNDHCILYYFVYNFYTNKSFIIKFKNSLDVFIYFLFSYIFLLNLTQKTKYITSV